MKLHLDVRFVTTEPLDNDDMSDIYGRVTALDGWQQNDIHRMWVIQAKTRDGHWIDPGYD